MMKTRTAVLATLSAALFAATAMPAAAAPNGQVSVSYNDLDLSTDAGRAELAQRYDQAARDLCGVKAGETKLHGKERYCYENNSKQLKQRVTDILAKHAAAGG